MLTLLENQEKQMFKTKLSSMINSKYLVYILIISTIFLLDRLSKVYIIDLAENTVNLEMSITSFLNIILVWNSGIGFGLFQIEKPVLYNLITFIILIINFIIIYFLISVDYIQKIFFCMILGGSFGNLYDRIYFSAVPDFIDLNYKGYHWFVFNVADIFKIGRAHV